MSQPTRPVSKTPPTNDGGRQFQVACAYVICIAYSLIGSGATGGTPIQEAAGGAFSTDATLLAPAGPAFSIWSLIYLGLGAYTVWQFFPSQKRHDLHRRIGPFATLSMGLNAAWIISAQWDQLWLTVILIIALLVVLCELMRRRIKTPSPDWQNAVFVDGVFGLYLGWVSVAVCANVAAALSQWLDIGPTNDAAAVGWAIAVLVIVAIAGVTLATVGGGRLTPAASLAWGLSWIAVARLTGDLPSTTTAIAALTAAAVIVVWTVIVRVKRIVTRS